MVHEARQTDWVETAGRTRTVLTGSGRAVWMEFERTDQVRVDGTAGDVAAASTILTGTFRLI